MTDAELGMRIRKIRKSLGLSQLDLATQCDMHPGYITNIELGKRSSTFATLNRIAEALNIPIGDLLSDDMPRLLDYGEKINRLIANVKTLNPDAQDALIEVIKMIRKNQWK